MSFAWSQSDFPEKEIEHFFWVPAHYRLYTLPSRLWISTLQQGLNLVFMRGFVNCKFPLDLLLQLPAMRYITLDKSNVPQIDGVFKWFRQPRFIVWIHLGIIMFSQKLIYTVTV